MTHKLVSATILVEINPEMACKCPSMCGLLVYIKMHSKKKKKSVIGCLQLLIVQCKRVSSFVICTN